MYKHALLLFVIIIGILILFLYPNWDKINSQDVNPWGKFQFFYDAQMKHLSNTTVTESKPVSNEYKWIVTKNN